MLFLEPTLRIGRHVQLDERVDFAERVAATRAAMEAWDVGAIIIVGDIYDSDALAYLSGMVPWNGWAALVLPADGTPDVVVSIGDREMPIATAQTGWPVKNAGGYPQPTAQLIGQIARSAAGGNAIGLAGGAALREGEALALISSALEGAKTIDADPMFEALMRVQDDRQRDAIRKATNVARDAIAMARTDNGFAPTVAEATAFAHGAHDVRILRAANGGPLRPIEGIDVAPTASLIICAVESDGYWGYAADTLGEAVACRTALDAMARVLRPGVSSDFVATAALHCLSPSQADQARSFGLGGGIGLSLSAAPKIECCGTDVVRLGDILALQVACEDGGQLACATVTMVVGEGGASELR